MIKYFCDKCGIELGENDFNKTAMMQFVSNGRINGSYDFMLCDNCNNKFSSKLKELKLQFNGEYNCCEDEDDYIG